MNNDYAPWKEIRTKVVGVTMGDDADTRQLAIKTIGEHFDPNKRWFLDLVPEPDNPYDENALKVMTDVPGMGRVQLGYVSNCEITCEFCGKEYPKWPTVRDSKGKTVKSEQCLVCSSDRLKRDGLATRMSQQMRRDPQGNYYGEVLSITGGTEDKPSSGCNFAIRKAYPRKKDS
jgi:hypothetical protein